MNFPCFRVLSLSFVSFLATAVVAVAQLLPEKEEDIPVEFIPRLENTVSIGYNRLSSGPRVRFGNLGMIGHTATQTSVTSGSATRGYANGSVTEDSRNVYETALAGGQLIGKLERPEFTSVANGELVTVYSPISIAQTDANGLVRNADGTYVAVTSPSITYNADGTQSTSLVANLYLASVYQFRSFSPSRARTWTVQSDTQIDNTNHTVSMSTYGTTSAGESKEADSSGSSGFELSFEHRLGQRGHFEWGVEAGVKLVGINAKAHGDVTAYLTQMTDVYKMATNADGSYSTATISETGASYAPAGDTVNAADLALTQLDGTSLGAYHFINATTKPLQWIVGGDQSRAIALDVSNVSFGTIQRDSLGRTVTVHGNWQLKGAYYMIRVGPTFRYRFNDTFAVSGSFGISQGFVGTTYKADEYFDDTLDVKNPDGSDSRVPYSAANAKLYTSREQNATHKFIPGVYGEVNVEYWMSERTGFYFGMTKQAMRDFTQTPLSGRTAKIDMGSSSGWKLGVMTRF